MTLSELIAHAAGGEALWMPDLRELFAAMPESSRLILSLCRIDGGREDRVLAIPRWDTAEEQQFIREYLWASVYNLLSVFSGRELRFYFDRTDSGLEDLFSELPQVFQLDEPMRCGYGKVISIANRLCRAQNLPPFSFTACSPEEYVPILEKSDVPADCALSEHLRRRASDAEHLTLCGIDIGGTDIKLALSVGGRLICTGEYDWNPAGSPTAEEILNPILQQVELLRRNTAEVLGLSAPPLLDAVGVSFPDIVIDDRILGGETPKTAGLRGNTELDYEEEFAKLSRLQELFSPQCRKGAPVRIVNDGNMAAFTAAMELACMPDPPCLTGGLIAHTLGTDLGTGWLRPDGTIPPLPLELYDLILDLGSTPSAAREAQDLRSVRNENSGLPGARRYLGQAAAFRLAQERNPRLLDGFTVQHDGILQVRTEPEDLRKPCLEHLMQLAASGNPDARQVFRRVGEHLGVLCREADYLLRPLTRQRYLYGRFVKSAECFSLLQEGCGKTASDVELVAADESLACSPLMQQLADRKDVTVAQFGQAVGALYYAVPA